MRTRKILRKASRKVFRKKWWRKEASALSTSRIQRAVLQAIEAALPAGAAGEHLDVGSGTGDLLRVVRERHGLRSIGCDYTDSLADPSETKIDIVDLNRQALPYADERFVLATCIETIEHLENFRAVIREIYRVLRPGGVAVFSTPNILNLRSRIRYFSSGFYNLFGPLAANEVKVYNTRGHINPVSWFYLSHALLSAGFGDLKVSVDKYQRRSFGAFVLLVGPIRFVHSIVCRREQDNYHTLDDRNLWTVRAMNSRDLLLGRTLIVSAVKPA